MKSKSKQKHQESEKKQHIIQNNRELTQCKDECEQIKKQYLRALADYKNLEHRVEQERYRMRDAIKRELVERLLSILDNLDQAEVFNKDPGLQIVNKSFRQYLDEFGVSEIELLGTDFDPSKAEVVEAIEGKQDNIIIEVLQKAYKLNGTVIRHGKVKVSKKSIQQKN